MPAVRPRQRMGCDTVVEPACSLAVLSFPGVVSAGSAQCLSVAVPAGGKPLVPTVGVYAASPDFLPDIARVSLAPGAEPSAASFSGLESTESKGDSKGGSHLETKREAKRAILPLRAKKADAKAVGRSLA